MGIDVQPQADFYPKKVVETIIKEEKEEVKRRIKVLRKGKELIDLKSKIVILIDDGLAMGSIMMSAS